MIIIIYIFYPEAVSQTHTFPLSKPAASTFCLTNENLSCVIYYLKLIYITNNIIIQHLLLSLCGFLCWAMYLLSGFWRGCRPLNWQKLSVFRRSLKPLLQFYCLLDGQYGNSQLSCSSSWRDPPCHLSNQMQ